MGDIETGEKTGILSPSHLARTLDAELGTAQRLREQIDATTRAYAAQAERWATREAWLTSALSAKDATIAELRVQCAELRARLEGRPT